jgi:hopanoid biosynthesis associated RND transporter like protein HpnN
MKAEPDHLQESTLVQRALVGLVDGVSRHPWLVLTLALLVSAFSLYAAYACLEYHTQRDDLVSPNKEYQKRWQRYVAEFGDDNDMVVVVKGHDRRQMENALESLAARVAQEPQLFDRLFYKVDLRPLRNRALLFLSTEQIAAIRHNLQRMSLLLDPPLLPGVDPLIGWKSLTLHQILLEAQRRLADLKPGQPVTCDDEDFRRQLCSLCRSATAMLDNPADYRNPWLSIIPQGPEHRDDLLAQPQYFFSADGTLAFLLVRPIQEADSFTAAEKSVAALRAIIARVGTEFSGLEFGLTGLPVLENDEMSASASDTHLASGLALAGIGVLFLLVYRGIRNPLLTVSTLLIGTSWSLGWLTLTVGHLNILSATFAVMLIGMGDYGVLWITRYEQNRAGGADVRTALRQTARGGGPSILTAATATALAFFAAMMADFQAVAELGWIAGSGVLLCALACFTVLPALLTIVDRRSAEDQYILPLARLASTGNRQGWLPMLAKRPRWVIGVSVAATVVLGAFAFRVSYDHNLLNLQAKGLDSVKWEMTLIDHTAGASWHALSYTSTPEEALVLKERYEQVPGVSRVVEVASLVPSGQAEKIGQLRDIQKRLHRLPSRETAIPHQKPKADDLRKQLSQLLAALDRASAGCKLPLGEGFEPLRTSLQQLHDKIAATVPLEAEARLQDFDNRLTRDIVDDMHRLREVSTPAAITLADLPPSLRERYIGKTGKWLLRVFARDCLWDHEPLRQFVEDIRTIDPEATGKPFGTLEGLQSLRSGFQWAGLYALVAIFLIFLADFRKPRYILWAFAPLGMGVLISLGVMGLCGLHLNPANIIAFPLILGVGAVYGVHVVHDYLVRRQASRYTLSHIIGRAILVMALTNMISFGTLMISSHRGLAGLGLVLTLGVSCCMVTALIFLPAFLRVRSQRDQVEELRSAEKERLTAWLGLQGSSPWIRPAG